MTLIRRIETGQTRITRWTRVAAQKGERKIIHGKEAGSFLLPFSMNVMDSLHLIFEWFNH